MDFKHLQQIIFDYFNDTDHKILVKVIEVFVFDVKHDEKEVVELIEAFVNDNGLTTSYEYHLYDLEHPEKFFTKSQLSDRDMISKVKEAMLVMSYNRFNHLVKKHDAMDDAITSKNDLLDLSKRIEAEQEKLQSIYKKINQGNNRKFNVLKNELINCFEVLNRNEQYFYSEKDDMKLLEKIRNTEFTKF